jgi:hypothetical protein
MFVVVVGAQVEYKWRLEGVEARASEQLKKILAAPPRIK